MWNSDTYIKRQLEVTDKEPITRTLESDALSDIVERTGAASAPDYLITSLNLTGTTGFSHRRSMPTASLYLSKTVLRFAHQKCDPGIFAFLTLKHKSTKIVSSNWRRASEQRHTRSSSAVCHAVPRVENRELLVGDAVAMVNFCLYKQIASIVTSPEFPGWLAPLSFSATRFSEFAGLTVTLTGTWIAAGMLAGAYTTTATADLQSALRTACITWLVAMPVAAAQLVLATAVESRALVGEPDFASAVPLAASGIGEPFVSASGVLALMTLWRCGYALYLDPFSLKGLGFRRQQFLNELYSFREALLIAILMAAIGSISLQVIQALDSVVSRNNI